MSSRDDRADSPMRDDGDASSQQAVITTPAPQAASSRLNPPSSVGSARRAAPSSPLNFPSSSPAKSMTSSGGAARRQQLRQGPASARNGPSSPLHFPTSSPSGTPRSIATPMAARSRQAQASSLRAASSVMGDEPLFFPSSSVASTPRQRRGEIHANNSAAPSPLALRGDRTHRQTDQHSAAGLPSDLSLSQMGVATDGPDAGEEAPESKVIWGTYVSISETMKMFRDFLHGFRLKYRWVAADLGVPPGRTPSDGEHLVYEAYMNRMRLTDQSSLNLRVSDLAAFAPSRKLAHFLVKYPNEVIPIMDQVLKDEMLATVYDEMKSSRSGLADVHQAEIERMETMLYKIRAFGLDGINMRDLNPADIDKLVTIRGLVIRGTPIIPDMNCAFFRCLACNHTIQVELDRGRINEPDRCPRDSCNQMGTLSLIHNRCEFADRQVVRLQETPDVVPDGQTPHTVTLCVYDELVDVAKPGDRVEVTGIFRSQPVRVNPRARTQKSLYKTFIDVVHVKRGDARRLAVDASTRQEAEQAEDRGAQAMGVGGEDDSEEIDLRGGQSLGGHGADGAAASSEDLAAKYREISRRHDVYELLARSLAPSIYELEDVKKGILLQLFGGTSKTIGTGGGAGGPRYRGDINVLMVGDPGTSKSQILQYVHKIAPRGVYASGKGSSAVGLTAYVTRDPDTKQLVLESGALVLSDGGVCCIDEFDKMSDATRSVLHEVMEQQTVSIAKAGIITTLNARTSILAAANPVGSRYNPNLPITKNIDLPPTLISRFDLVYLVLDKVDESADRRLARHLVGLYLEDRPKTAGTDVLNISDLTSYISYARNHVHPVLTEAAGEALTKAYVAMRKVGEDARSAERRITATTRQLESMIRLSEAHARMRLSETVEDFDVEEADRLIREAIRSSATDKDGLIDMELLYAGRGAAERKMAGDLRKELLALLDAMGGGDGTEQASSKPVRYTELARQLNAQSSVPVDAAELASVVRQLEHEGVVRSTGERERRTLRRIAA